MKIAALFSFLFLVTSLMAQKQVAVYTHNGSKVVGTLVRLDSVSQSLKIKILGGSEFFFLFKEIDSLTSEAKMGWVTYGKPYFGFGLGAIMNADHSYFQFDVLAGYQFTDKIKGGIGFCFSDIAASYLDFNYYFFHKDFFAIGAYTQPGMVLTRLFDRNYYTSNSTTGFYSNTGLTMKFYSGKASSFAMNIGYEYINKIEVYKSYNNDPDIKKTYHLNRYVVQGIYTF